MESTERNDILQRYEKDGYVIFRGILDKALTDEAFNHVDWLLKKHPSLKPDELNFDLARDDPFWLRLVSDERLLNIAEIFVGGDIALFATHYICKPPRSGRPVLWHQDGAFWPLEPMNVASLWVALTESNPSNGCLKVIPGSHHESLASMDRRDDVDSALGFETSREVDESQALCIELHPGDVEVHHPNIIHGSDANESEQWRRGLTIRVIPTSTRITDAGAASPFLLRGRPVEGINTYLPKPRFTRKKHFPFRDQALWEQHPAPH